MDQAKKVINDTLARVRSSVIQAKQDVDTFKMEAMNGVKRDRDPVELIVTFSRGGFNVAVYLTLGRIGGRYFGSRNFARSVLGGP